MNFFINRPIFASVLALVLVISGAIAALQLPVAQYPVLAPPEVEVSTQYIGASAEVVADTVTIPLEEDINGVEGMIYMSSNSTNNGDSIITVTFEVGYDGSFALFDTQNKANQAVAELPSQVMQIGLTTEKQSTNLLLAVNLTSPGGTRDAQFLANYADIHVYDALMRIPGIASINNLGLRKYAIRIWLDPRRLNNLGLTATDVQAAIEDQNQQVAAGQVGQEPAPKNTSFTYQLNALGRLTQISEFEDIILHAGEGGSVVHIRDVARVELGSEEYNWAGTLNGKPAAILAIFQLSNANGLDLAANVTETMTELEKYFPADMAWSMPYNTTTFVSTAIHEVIVTLLQATGLVFLVVFVFLQNWRTTLIPALTIPVSLIGTLAIMSAFGFSINTLSLLGMVLAVGLVVDDAIVIVENVSRKLGEATGKDVDVREITKEAMAEVRGPIIATTLALMAVFVPSAFMPGMTGLLYLQFALTIAFAVGLSGFNSLSLSPALCAVLLRPPDPEKKQFAPFRIFNDGFEKLANGYAAAVTLMIKARWLSMAVFAGLCVVAYLLVASLPTAFVPEEDQGYFICNVALPEGASLQRTEAVIDEVRQIVMEMDGVTDFMAVAGYNLIDSVKQPNMGAGWVVLEPWDDRKAPELHIDALLQTAQTKFAAILDARVLAINAPPIPGLGSTGGFTFELQDRQDKGTTALATVTDAFLKQANADPALSRVYTTFEPNFPQRFLDFDRTKAKQLGLSVTDVFNTLQINLGSLYVNEFNRFGRVYRVYLQAEQEHRAEPDDITQLKVRNNDGEMVDMSTLIEVERMVGPYNVPHYQMYPSAAINGSPAQGYSTGQAVAAMEHIAGHSLPEGFGYEWTGVVYQQIQAGNAAPFIFGISLIFVFLVLAAQYESWTMPIMVLLAVPTGLLGAALGLVVRELALDVYAQIGLLMLIGLTAKNAILIVEFARDKRAAGASILEAASEAARIRLRPILMTAFAFILGTLPLMFASGAGANSRQSLGTVVVIGLSIATLLVIFVPVFYYIIQSMRERGSLPDDSTADHETPHA